MTLTDMPTGQEKAYETSTLHDIFLKTLLSYIFIVPVSLLYLGILYKYI